MAALDALDGVIDAAVDLESDPEMFLSDEYWLISFY